MASSHPQGTASSLSAGPSLPAASDNSCSNQATNATPPPSISSQDDGWESGGSSLIEDDKRINDRPSNEKLLVSFIPPSSFFVLLLQSAPHLLIIENNAFQWIAFVSFMSFALVQAGASYYAGSVALMGDSAAMIVDALTYLFNLLAERKKNRFRQETPHSTPYDLTCIELERAKSLQQRKLRKHTLQLELITPLISVLTLLVVTGFIMHAALQVLILDFGRDVSEQSDPNVHLMLLLSGLNLILDFVNVFCFAKVNHASRYTSKDDGDSEGNGEASNYDADEDTFQNETIEEFSKQEDDNGNHSNLNMCSAYTVSETSDDQEPEMVVPA
jgi:Co/Zn/Cd efflux system component